MSNKNDVPKILRDLKKINLKKKIKIRYKELSAGFYSLYLDVWHNEKRQYEFLKIYIKGNRSSSIDDENKLKLAISIREKKELELYQQDTGFELASWKSKANFVEYVRNLIESGLKPDRGWKNTYNYINKFTNGKIQINSIDKKFCESFKEYLLKNVCNNSAHTYFAVFKAALNRLVREDVIQKSPTPGIRINNVETHREFLSFEEIKLLKNTPCKSQQLKNAFLFSCYTGLRISDIRTLTFNKIKDGYLTYRQYKTKSPERIKLSTNALEIFEEQKQLVNENKIFNLKSNVYICNKLREWIEKAGIKKHITFHSARHTFATLCLTYDIDLYTVSKLLGHRDIKTTQIYAKLIDKKKDEAVDKLPKI